MTDRPGVAHVIAPPAPTVSSTDRRTSAAAVLLASRLADHPGERVVCLGPRSAQRGLAALGVGECTAILPSRGLAHAASRRLRGALSGIDEVHAWGVPALGAVLAARARGTRLVAHLDDEPPEGFNPSSAPDVVEAYDDQDADRWTDLLGANAGVDVVEPSPRVPLDERERLRGALGIHDDSVVIAALWDPASTLDARRFMFRIGFLELLERPTVAILPAEARRLSAARRFRSAASLRFRLLISPAPLPALFPALDALASLDPEPHRPPPARGATRVLARLAEHAGVPVAEPTRSDAPPVVTREMAEFMPTLIKHVDAADKSADDDAPRPSEKATP